MHHFLIKEGKRYFKRKTLQRLPNLIYLCLSPEVSGKLCSPRWTNLDAILQIARQEMVREVPGPSHVVTLEVFSQDPRQVKVHTNECPVLEIRV